MLEVVAYYVPWLDNALDVAATPAAVVAGVLASAAAITDLPPVLTWGIALIGGGGAAGLLHGATSLLRLKSTAVTGGAANPVVVHRRVDRRGGDVGAGVAGAGGVRGVAVAGGGLGGSSTHTKTKEGCDMIRTIVRPLVLTLVSVSALAAQDAKKPPYEFVADFSLAASQGNQEVNTLSLGQRYSYVFPAWKFSQTASALRGSANGVKNAELYQAGIRGDYNLTKKLTAYLSVDGLRNTPAGLNNQFAEGVGLGYKFLDTDIDKLQLSLGLGALQRSFVGVADRQNDFVGNAAGMYRHMFSKVSYFEQTAGFTPNFTTTDALAVHDQVGRGGTAFVADRDQGRVPGELQQCAAAQAGVDGALQEVRRPVDDGRTVHVLSCIGTEQHPCDVRRAGCEKQPALRACMPFGVRRCVGGAAWRCCLRSAASVTRAARTTHWWHHRAAPRPGRATSRSG